MTAHARARPGVGRRNFLKYAWWGAFGLLSAQAAAATGLFFWPVLKEGSFGSMFEVGNINELPPVGSVTYFSEFQIYLSHVPEGIIAMWRKCPHLGCVVPWEPALPSLDDIEELGNFTCPCHNSQYNRYGEIIAGPAPRPLDYFPIEIADDGTIIADTGTVIQRSEGLDKATQITPV